LHPGAALFRVHFAAGNLTLRGRDSRSSPASSWPASAHLERRATVTPGMLRPVASYLKLRRGGGADVHREQSFPQRRLCGATLRSHRHDRPRQADHGDRGSGHSVAVRHLRGRPPSPRQLVGQHDRVSRLPAFTADSLGTMRRRCPGRPIGRSRGIAGQEAGMRWVGRPT
jgi:hypothetical protein